MKSNITINKDKRDYLISEIKTYFYKEREENLGDLAAGLMLDFIVEKLAPEFYNQGIYDSYKYMGDKLEDLLGLQA